MSHIRHRILLLLLGFAISFQLTTASSGSKGSLTIRDDVPDASNATLSGRYNRECGFYSLHGIGICVNGKGDPYTGIDVREHYNLIEMLLGFMIDVEMDRSKVTGLPRIITS